MSTRLVVLAALAFVVVGAVADVAAAPPQPNQPKQVQVQPGSPAVVPLRPDLIVEKIWVAGTAPNPGGGTRVDVRYTIANTTPIDSWKSPTPAGTKFWHDYPSMYQQMYSSVDTRELPNGVFPQAQGTECPIMLGANARYTCYRTVIVPAGKQVQIRATVDTLNYIAESYENNNSRTVTWPLEVAHPAPH